MKKLHFAWIEQVLSFDSDPERAEYIRKQKALAEYKKQAPVQVVSLGNDDGRFTLRIRKPYNSNHMMKE